ncbi:hypothetical protein GGI42DRAFT_333064 [Trichoderma sp. SZMC 28013]
MCPCPNRIVQDRKPGSSIKHNHPRSRPIKPSPNTATNQLHVQPCQTLSPCLSTLLLAPLQSRGSHPTACPLPPASLSPAHQSPATALQDNKAVDGKGTRYGKASLPCSQAGWPREQRHYKWRLLVTPYLYSLLGTYITFSSRTCACHQTASGHSQRAGTCKGLGDCHWVLSSSSSRAVHAAKH